MNSNIILERCVPVRCWHVLGKVAKARERPELMPVLLRARETGGTDACDLANHLLFEPRSRRVVGERLLHIAHAYRLVKKKEPEQGTSSHRASGVPLLSFSIPRTDSWKEPSPYEEIRPEEERDGVYALTEAGETAIDTGEVLVPEYGAWSIWESEDPLFPSRILRIASWEEPSAFDEVRGTEKESARRRVLLPDWLRDVAGTPIRPAGQGAAVRVYGLERQAEAVDGELRLSWNVGDGRLQLTGSPEGKDVETELEAPPISPDRIWSDLLTEKALMERWDMDRQNLRVSFDETDETEREAMSLDLTFESPDVSGYGRFETLTVREVPITPATEADAQLWAKWRLGARIRDYATSERYAAWRAEAADPFDQYEVELPTRTELLNEFWDRTNNRPEPRAWRLAAAEDWSL